MSGAEFSDKGRGYYTARPGWDVYTTMLLLSLLAILVAIIFLVAELSAYNWDYKATSASSPVAMAHAVEVSTLS